MLVRIEEFELQVNALVGAFVDHVKTRGCNRDLRSLSEWQQWFHRWQEVCLKNQIDYTIPHWEQGVRLK